MEAVYALNFRGGPLTKAVALNLAYRACEFCSLCWPGVKSISDGTLVGITRVREALDELVQDGTLTIHAYPHGGRGRSTEYIVRPGVEKPVPAPCAKCQKNMKSHRPAMGMTETKPTAPRGVSSKPTAGTPQNPPQGGYQHPYESEQPRARAREEDSASTRTHVETTTRPHSSPETTRAAELAMQQLTQAVPNDEPQRHPKKP